MIEEQESGIMTNQKTNLNRAQEGSEPYLSPNVKIIYYIDQ